jgi:hypothetical protein
MTTVSQLLNRVLGVDDFKSVSVPARDTANFEYFDVELPGHKYRGFPPSWSFAILHDSARPPDEHVVEQEVDALVRKTTKETFLVIVSDAPRIHLHDNLSFPDRSVFFVDHADLNMPRPHLPPLLAAIQRQMDRNQLSVFRITPYQKGMPALGWRFYGRQRELELLMNTSDSYVIVGGRRIGKTSLMKEASDRLRRRGEVSYYLSVEECKSAEDVMRKLLIHLSARDVQNAIRRHEALNESMWTAVLKRLTATTRPTLFLDEMGNVITEHKDEDWKFLGVLRQFYHQGLLRFVISCFQEYFLLQQEEFTGPLINFATTMRLGPFSRTEAADLVLVPLELWRPIGGQREDVRRLVEARVGRHPLFLQSFCYDLFERVARHRDDDILAAVRQLLNQGLVECFGDANDQVFLRQRSSTLCYLFLRRCREAEKEKRPLIQCALDDDWVKQALRDVGYEASLSARRNLLEGMEVRGLTTRQEGRGSDTQVVIAPVIYYVARATHDDIDKYIASFADDIRFERGEWQLARLVEERDLA